MIRIYPNKLDGAPCETHETERRMTVAAWLDSMLKDGFKPGDSMPISVKVEGEIIDATDWHDFVFRPRDEVEIRLEPKGTDPFSITVALFAGVKAVFSMLVPQLPGTPNTPGSGDSLIEGSATGNQIKLGDVIRESFGTQKIFPDYLLPARKYFKSPREQWLEMLLCVGKGDFQILANNVRIGDTPLLALGAEASYQIYAPGQSLVGQSAADWWHQVTEVGSSSTGAAGLELTATTAITPSATASQYVFNGYTISVPSGAGAFPTDWSVGLVLRVIAPYTYTVTDGASGAADVITGPLGMLNPTVGDIIEVAGTNAGNYEVANYTGGSSPQMTLNFIGGAPANGLVTGTGEASIGPDGLRFKITSFSANSITVDRLDESGSVDTSFPGFDSLTTVRGSLSVDSSSLEGGWRGPFPVCPQNESTSTIEFDVMYPNGLSNINLSSGDVGSQTCVYEVQYRDINIGGAYTSVTFSDTNNTLNQVGYTHRIGLPYQMRAEMRMRKVSPITDHTDVHATVQWYGLRSLLQGPTSYPGCTVLAVKVQVSDRIAAQTQSQIYVIGTRLLPVRQNRAWATPQATRQIVPVVGYIARTLGYSDDYLDLVEMDRLQATWSERGDTFDYAYTDETTAKDAINDAFGVGFAELTFDRGLLRPARDEPRSTFEHMYTPQNFTEQLTRVITSPSADDYTGVDVTYVNSSDWTEATIECRLPGDGDTKVEKVTAKGITSATKAWQFGMRRRRIQYYRRDTYSWSTEMDALNSRYLSYCSVSDDVPGYGQTAMLESYTDLGSSILLESSEPLDWSAGGAYAIQLRRPDGTVSGPWTPTRVDDYRFTVDNLDFIPEVDWVIEPPHIQFGPIDRVSYPVLVSSISPDGMYSASVEAIGYDARVYLDDDNAP